MESIEALVAVGEAQRGVEEFLRRVAGLTEEEIDLLRSSPTWGERVSAAHTLSREQRAGGAHLADLGRFTGATVPVLLLTGTESPSEYRITIDRLAETLPNATLRLLPGQGHAATVTAPEMLASEILHFAAGHGGHGRS